MEIQMDKDLRFVFEALPSFGRHSSLVMGYACLFGVTPFAVKAAKLRHIIEEMKRLFDAQAFSYQKKTYAISHAGIAEALDLCVKKDFQEHLENHNYLKKVMITISEREGKNQSRQAEKDLRAREDKYRAGSRAAELTPEPGTPQNNRIDRGSIPTRTIQTTPGVPLKCRDCSPNNPSPITEEQRQRNLARVGNIIKGIGG